MSRRKKLLAVVATGRRDAIHDELDYAAGPGRLRFGTPLGATREGPVTHWGMAVRDFWAPLEAVLAAAYPNATFTDRDDRGIFRTAGGDFLAGWVERDSLGVQGVLDTLGLVRVRWATPEGGGPAQTAIDQAEAAEAAVTWTPQQLADLRARVDAELADRISASQTWYDAYGMGEGVASILAGS